MFDNIYFGLFLTTLAYFIGLKINQKFKSPFLNPLLISMVIIVGFLLLFKIDLQMYLQGTTVFDLFLVVTSVALAVPFYKNFDIVKKNAIPLIGGGLVGSVVSVFSVLILGKLLAVDFEVIKAMMAKSITTGIAVPLITELNGIVPLAAVSIVFTGLGGAVIGPVLLKALGVTDPISYGVAMGVTSHVTGTAKAAERGEEEAAFAGLSIAIAGLITVVIFPIALSLL